MLRHLEMQGASWRSASAMPLKPHGKHFFIEVDFAYISPLIQMNRRPALAFLHTLQSLGIALVPHTDSVSELPVLPGQNVRLPLIPARQK